MKIICIAGRNEIAVCALTYLKDNFPDFEYLIVPTKDDVGTNGWQPSLIFHARKLNVKEVSLPDVYNISDLVFISLQFDLLVDPDLFRSKFLFNIHFSALPKFKGMYTSVHPILQNETSTGVTLHRIDKGIDTGEIIDQIIFPLDDHITSKELYTLYSDNSLVLFKKNIKDLLENSFTAKKQSARGSSYFSKKSIDFSNIVLDLNKTSFQIHNQFRAFTFREYQLPKFKNWNIYKTEITERKSSYKPGALLFEDETSFLISTIDYDIKLFKDYYDALWVACESGEYEAVCVIVNFIPDINLRNKKGWNALIIAVYNNQYRIAEFLLNRTELNADVNASNYKGTTVAMYALTCYRNTGDDSILKLVISFSPNLKRTDEKGMNFFDYVENENKVLKLL